MRGTAACAPLVIVNDGPKIVATNYWNTPLADVGGVFCSIYAGGVRVLLPRNLDHRVAEMVGREVIVTRGPWPAAEQSDALELMWENDSDSPFSIWLGAVQVDGLLTPRDAAAISTCLVYARRCDGAPFLVGRWPGKVRVARSLPCLLPWGR